MPDQVLTARGTGNKLGECMLTQDIILQEFIMSTIYGFNFSLLVLCYYLIHGPSRNVQRAGKGILTFVTILFGVTTFQVIAYMDCYWFALGPNSNTPQPARTVVINVFISLEAILADSLMIYRCFIVWNRRWLYIAIPLAILITSIVTNIIFLRANAIKDLTHQKMFFITSIGLSVAINVITSILISARILWYRKQLSADADARQSKWYSQLVAIFIESVALYTIIGIVQALLLATNNTGAEHIVGPLAGQISCTAALILTVRMGLGFSDQFTPAQSTSITTTQVTTHPSVVVSSISSSEQPPRSWSQRKPLTNQLPESPILILSPRNKERFSSLEASDDRY